MLADTIRILDFDGSVARQKGLLTRFPHHLVDCSDVGAKARVWLDGATARQVRDRLDPGLANTITFLGSGDFHHISGLLVGQFEEPLTLIVFDHHPDWDILPPRLGCGSWVTYSLRRPNVEKALLLGISSDDISTFDIQTGNLSSLSGDRVEIYPYAHGPTRVFFSRVPENRSLRATRKIFRTDIAWNGLEGTDLVPFFRRVIGRLGSRKAYVSIDKDCLRKEHALTNWEEGGLSLEELLALLRVIKEGLDIIGLDITGEYSPPEASGAAKRFLSFLDHPRGYSARGRHEDEIDSVNEATNIRLLELLLKG